MCTCSKSDAAGSAWYTWLLVLPHERTEVQGRERLAQGHGASESQNVGRSGSRAHALSFPPAVSEPEPQVSV